MSDLTCSQIGSLVFKRMELFSIPKRLMVEVVKDYKKVRNNCGPEYAVKRMKYISLCVLQEIAQDKPIPIKDDCSFWIKKKDNRTFSGAYGALQRYARKSEKRLKEVLKFLKFYTLELDSSFTDEKIQKYKSDLEEPYNGSIDQLEYYSKLVAQAARRLRTPKYLKTKDVKVPCRYEICPRMKPHQEELFFEDAFRVMSSPLYAELSEKHPWIVSNSDFMNYAAEKWIFAINPNIEADLGVKANLERFNGSGIIFNIPTPGLKDRTVNNFHKLYENLTRPFGDRLYDIVKTLSYDITFDESKCYDAIHSHLKAGKTAYCFDLSKATDRFPWALQHSFLTSLLPKDCSNYHNQLALANDLVKAQAYLPNGEYTHWQVGQPMGAYFSFASFTLTHGAILFALNGFKEEGFYVHGDDLVILDKNLADAYTLFLKECDIPCNMSKSLISNKFAEINSKLISADSVISIPKWKEVNERNVLDLIADWGLPIVDHLRFKSLDNEKKTILKRWAQLPEDLGLGLNPDGLSSDDRLEGFYFLLDDYPAKNLSYDCSKRKLLMERFDKFRDRTCNIQFNNEFIYHMIHPIFGLIQMELMGALEVATASDQDTVKLILDHVDSEVRSTLQKVVPTYPNCSEFLDKNGYFLYDLDDSMPLGLSTPLGFVLADRRLDRPRIRTIIRKYLANS